MDQKHCDYCFDIISDLDELKILVPSEDIICKTVNGEQIILNKNRCHNFHIKCFPQIL